MSLSNIIMLLVVLLLVGAGYFFYRRLKPMRSAGTPRTIDRMQAGGVMTLSGIGDEVEDLDFIVLGRHLYEEEGDQWIELEGEIGPDRKLWISVEQDDELEVCATLRKVGLEDLNLTAGDLERFWDQERGKLTFEGTSYRFEECGQATFYRNGDRSKGEPFKYWEFYARGDNGNITIERWKRGAVECHISQMLKPSQYQVHTLSE